MRGHVGAYTSVGEHSRQSDVDVLGLSKGRLQIGEVAVVERLKPAMDGGERNQCKASTLPMPVLK